eukprot:g31967.t1
MSESEGVKAVYVCGYSLRLANSNNAAELEQNLRNKVNAVQADKVRFPIDKYQVPKFATINQSITMLDHTFFGVNGAQAERLDPQIYLLMETATEALIDSGLTLDDIQDTETGVYVGACFSDMHSFTLLDEEIMTGYEHTGCAKAMFSNRISYTFNLHGPSMTIDTACSSSLVALVQAYNDLQSGRCSTALVGGSSLILDPAGCVGFNKFQMLAPDGHCKSFDQSGDGFARADGIVSLFLTTDPKYIRLHPHAQLLSAETNAVGKHPKGITFPCGVQQGKLYRRTFARAKLDPKDVQYIEAHGTGTKAGDHEELEGVKGFFGDRSDLTIGSIKSNVGHCEGCSGLAGLSKVLLMLEKKTYFPQLHIHNLHPDLGRLRVLTETCPFSDRDRKHFRAVVSSYGFGGANACVVVANVDKPPASSLSSSSPSVFPNLTFLSHRTAEGLAAWQAALPSGHQPQLLQDINRFPYRGIGPTEQPLFIDNERVKRLPAVYLVLTGNGSQWGGMGKALMEHNFFREVLERCGADVPQLVASPVLKPDVVSQTRALTAIQVALIDLLRAYGVQFAGVVAHSAGEIAAGYAAGAYDLQTTMDIATARGAAADLYTTRNAGCPGAMAAVVMDAKTVVSYLQGEAQVACYNTPSSITISGPATDVKQTIAKLKKEVPGIKCKILEGIRVPYHHQSLLQPQAAQLVDDLKRALPGQPVAFPQTWFPAVQGLDNSRPFSFSYHLDSVLRPVDFPAACKNIPDKALLVEVGPHGIMRPYLTELLPEADYVSLMTKGKSGLETVQRALGQLWLQGVPLQAPVSPERLPLETRVAAVSWDRREFKLVDYTAKNRNSGGGKDFTFDLEGADAYLRDHFIDGRALFPATGYVYLIAQAYGQYPQTIHDFKILRPVMLFDPEVTLRVSLLANGEATVCYNDEIVATGRVTGGTCDDKEPVEPPFLDATPPSQQMDADTFYQLVNRHGYEYKTEFQGLRRVVLHADDSTRSLGQLSAQHPIAFLDAMLQLSILRGMNGLRLPTEIRRVSFAGPVPDAAWVEHDSLLGRVSGGGVTIEGLETSVAPRAPQANLIDISFTQEELLWCGRNDYSSPRHGYLHQLMNYGLALLAQQPDAAQHKRAQAVRKIMAQHDPSLLQPPDLALLRSTPDNWMYQILTQAYGSGNMLNEPIHSLAATSLLDKIYAENLGFDLHFMEMCLSVVRAHTDNNLLRFFEIGTGTGGFFKIISTFLHPQDTMVTSDCEQESRFIHNDVTLKLDFQFQYCDVNQAPSKQVETILSNTDILIAHNALHVADDLHQSLTSFTKHLKPGGFVMLYECTSPFYLTSFGLDETTWNYKDKRSFGLWLSVPEWLDHFARAGLQVVSYSSSQDEIATVFLVRKIASTIIPTPVYVSTAQDSAFPTPPEKPTLFVTEPQTGYHGFVRTLAREGYPVQSLECLEGKTGECLRNQTLLADAARLGLRTYVTRQGRLGTHVHTNLPDHPTQPLLASSPPPMVHAEVSVPGDLNSVVLTQTLPRVGTRVRVAYSALNFRDVMLASNKINRSTFHGYSRNGCGIGLEISGRCEKTGKNLMGFGLDALANIVETPYVWAIPPGLSLRDGATIPVVYLTVYYAFYRAKLRAGQSVLIHAGTGGVGQAAIRVAHSLGCEIFTTCNANKRAHLRKLFPFLQEDHIGDSRSSAFERTVMRGTKGKGVHAVLNSLAGDLLIAGWRCVRQHGYFLEIGKYDLMKNTALGMGRFIHNITFVGIDIDQVFEVPDEMEELSRRFQAGLSSGVVQPLESTLFSYSQLPEAMRYLASGRHTGKVVIDMAEVHGTEPEHKQQNGSLAGPVHYRPRFFTHGTHLVTGGLGGFGLELAQWLAERGAEHVVLATRAGGKVRSAHQTLVLESLRTRCRVTIAARDLSLESEVKALVRQVGAMTGVWHLAMELNDCLFKDMTEAKWEGTVRPKSLMGTQLDKVCRTAACETFVCFSSITSKNGNAGQSNYAYTNNVLEQLCRARRAAGLPALSVQWGAIGDVGFVARHKNHGALMSSMTAAGIDSQPISSCLQYLETALLSESASPVMSSSRKAHPDKVEVDANEGGAGANLLQVVGKILQVDLSQVGEDVKLSEVGLDSLSSAVCHAAICRSTGSTFPLTEMSSMTVGRLVVLQGKVAAPKAAGAKPAKKKAPPATATSRTPPSELQTNTTKKADNNNSTSQSESEWLSIKNLEEGPRSKRMSPKSLVESFAAGPPSPHSQSGNEKSPSVGNGKSTQKNSQITMSVGGGLEATVDSLEVLPEKVIVHHPSEHNHSNGHSNGYHFGESNKKAGRYYYSASESNPDESTFVQHEEDTNGQYNNGLSPLLNFEALKSEKSNLWEWVVTEGPKLLEPEPRNQLLLSFMHSILAVLINFWAVSRVDRSSGFAIPFMFSLLYVIGDVLIFHKVIANDRTAIIHHILFFGVCFWCLLNHKTEAALTTSTLMASFEVSTIFFNAYYLFYQEWIFFAFAATFTLFRVCIGGSILVPQAIYHFSENYLFASICGLSVYLLQLYWFRGIVLTTQRRLNGTHKKRMAVKVQVTGDPNPGYRLVHALFSVQQTVATTSSLFSYRRREQRKMRLAQPIKLNTTSCQQQKKIFMKEPDVPIVSLSHNRQFCESEYPCNRPQPDRMAAQGQVMARADQVMIVCVTG